jgi:glutaredoxin-like YruB-family protein
MQKITIYTLSWCPHCIALKEYLKAKNYEFENIDVEEDEDAAEDIIEKTNQEGFPIVAIGDDIIIGFDPKKIEEYFNK